MSELLPCPFCGEATHIHVYPPTCRPETPYNPADRLFPIARCAKCYAEVAGKNEDYGMKSAIAAWNTRAPQAEIESAMTYLRNLLTSFVQEHCDPVPEWAPLPDLWGMLTQIDNAITVTRDRQSEIVRLREVLSKFMDYADAEYVPNTLFDRARAALSGSKE